MPAKDNPEEREGFTLDVDQETMIRALESQYLEQIGQLNRRCATLDAGLSKAMQKLQEQITVNLHLTEMLEQLTGDKTDGEGKAASSVHTQEPKAGGKGGGGTSRKRK